MHVSLYKTFKLNAADVFEHSESNFQLVTIILIESKLQPVAQIIFYNKRQGIFTSLCWKLNKVQLRTLSMYSKYSLQYEQKSTIPSNYVRITQSFKLQCILCCLCNIVAATQSCAFNISIFFESL